MNERNRGSNYPLILHRKCNTETNIKQSLPYVTSTKPPKVYVLYLGFDFEKNFFQVTFSMQFRKGTLSISIANFFKTFNIHKIWLDCRLQVLKRQLKNRSKKMLKIIKMNDYSEKHLENADTSVSLLYNKLNRDTCISNCLKSSSSSEFCTLFLSFKIITMITN